MIRINLFEFIHDNILPPDYPLSYIFLSLKNPISVLHSLIVTVDCCPPMLTVTSVMKTWSATGVLVNQNSAGVKGLPGPNRFNFAPQLKTCWFWLVGFKIPSSRLLLLLLLLLLRFRFIEGVRIFFVVPKGKDSWLLNKTRRKWHKSIKFLLFLIFYK